MYKAVRSTNNRTAKPGIPVSFFSLVMGDISNFDFDTISIWFSDDMNKININIIIKIWVYRVWSIIRLTSLEKLFVFIVWGCSNMMSHFLWLRWRRLRLTVICWWISTVDYMPSRVFWRTYTDTDTSRCLPYWGCGDFQRIISLRQHERIQNYPQ